MLTKYPVPTTEFEKKIRFHNDAFPNPTIQPTHKFLVPWDNSGINTVFVFTLDKKHIFVHIPNQRSQCSRPYYARFCEHYSYAISGFGSIHSTISIMVQDLILILYM